MAPRPHPLHSLMADEITRSFGLLKKLLRQKHGDLPPQFRIKDVSIREPPKALLLPYLNAEAAGIPPARRPFVPRCVDIVWSTGNDKEFHESTLSLDTMTEVQRVSAPAGQHANLTRYD